VCYTTTTPQQSPLLLTTGPGSCWLEEFLSWCEYDTECEPYLTHRGYFDGKDAGQGVNMRKIIHNFLDLKAFNHYSSDIVFSDVVNNKDDDDRYEDKVINGSKLITVSRGLLTHHNVKSSSDKVDGMVAGYRACKESPFGLKHAFNYSEIYIFVTQCKIGSMFPFPLLLAASSSSSSSSCLKFFFSQRSFSFFH
jgi:hypothetical protein